MIRTPSFSATETRDAVQHSGCITGWRQPSYEHVGCKPFQGFVSELCLWPVQIILERIDQPCVYRGSPWDGAFIFLSRLTSDGDLHFNGRQINDGVVAGFPWNFSDRVYVRGPTQNLAIAVDGKALADYASIALDREITQEWLDHSVYIGGPDAVSTFQHFALTMLRDLAAQPALLDSDSYRTTSTNRILDLLVGILDASKAAPRKLSPPSTRSYIVEKAEQFMNARLSNQVDISDVCESLRVCPRTLRYSFEDVVGVSPTQYLRAMRLGRVRRDLLRTGESGNIRCIAERYGFAHMGRFAQFYGDAFGELPSDTATRKQTRSRVDRTGGRMLHATC